MLFLENDFQYDLSLQGNADEGIGASLPVLKRARGCQVQQHKDEQAISEASLNKLVGAVDTYNLEVEDS